MPEYRSPGVYIEEVDTGPRPIQAVPTSTAGFVGVTQRGPADGRPQLVTNYDSFVRQFGGPVDPNVFGDARHLARSVLGFFENGGQQAYVKRVVRSDALRSTLSLDDGIVVRLEADSDAAVAEVRLTSLVGVVVGGSLAFRRVLAGGALGAPINRNIVGVDLVTRAVTLDASPGDFGRTSTAVEVRAPGLATLDLEARDPGTWGDDVRVRVEYPQGARTRLVSSVAMNLRGLVLTAGAPPVVASVTLDVATAGNVQTGDVIEVSTPGQPPIQRIASVAAGTITFSQDAGGGVLAPQPIPAAYAVAATTFVNVTALHANGTALYVRPDQIVDLAQNDFITIRDGQQSADVQVAAIDLLSGRIDLAAAPGTPNHFSRGAQLTLTTLAARAGASSVRVKSSRPFYRHALVEISSADGATRAYHVVADVVDDDLLLATIGGLATPFDNTASVRVVEFDLIAEYVNEVDYVRRTEVHAGLTLDSRVTSRFVQTVVNRDSELLRVTNVTSIAGALPLPTTDTGAFVDLAGGSNGTIPNDADFIGQDRGPNQRTGIQALGEIDEVSIVAVPGISSEPVQSALINHCETLQDRFAILDPPGDSSIEEVEDHRNNYDTQYAALYYPWLVERRSGVEQPMPPSGHLAGIYARTDLERGVFKSPANELLRDISGFEFTVTKREQDVLNPKAINVLRDFRTDRRGYRVWGARVMTSNTRWRYVNVRRLFIMIEESLQEGLQWAVFENNSRALWQRMTQSVSRFLTTQWRAGALMGDTPGQAFFVQCDETTMTQDDIDQGRLIMRVGAAPVRPAEFIIVRIGQTDSGTFVEEL
ncbi:MAG: phage tail sheath subtilisin-like domain-containing protein [Deltaproteobacteria bacterium]